MKLQLYILLLSLLMALPTFSSAQSLSEYVGHYTLPKEARPFPKFYQIDLFEDTTAGSFAARLIFASTTHDQHMCRCETRKVNFQRDSLTITMDNCFDERYEFVGRFVRKPKLDDEDYLLPVLVGLLSHYLNNQLLAKKRAAFRYDPLGD